MLTDDQRAKIANVIIVMMENRSFDHGLGYLSLQESGYCNWHAIEGVRQPLAAGYVNQNPAGPPVAPTHLDLFWNAACDPPHERKFVKTQLGTPSPQGVFPMNGFVQSYYDANGGVFEPGVVGYYGPNEVGTFDFFAKNLLVCDHWFAPLPTSTQPNRLMAMSGYALRDYTSSVPDVANQDLVYDWLNGKASWAVYSEGHPFATVIPARIPSILTGNSFRKFDEIDPGNLPQVAFIEPRYTNDFGGTGAADDDHWPSGIHQGQLFLFRVYERLFGQGQTSSDLWSGCVMIVTYDEHGGFFDHVSPLPIETPVPHGASYTDPFLTTGPRVPAFVISPFVTPGSVSALPLDHTSILKFLGRLYGGNSYEPWVDDRAGVGSVDDVLDNFASPVAEPPKFGDVGSQQALDQVKWMAARPAPIKPVGKSTQALAMEAAARKMWTDHPREFAAKYPKLATYLSRLPKPK